MKTLADAFEHTLQDIYYAENQITKALPKMQEAAGDAALKDAFAAHLTETKEQIKLLRKVFKSVGAEAKGEKCDAIEGLIKEGEGIIEEAEGTALDAMLIGAAQAVEHYEIARYGTLREWAKQLGHDEAHDLLSQILDMEKAANAKLTGLAVQGVNAPSGRKKESVGVEGHLALVGAAEGGAGGGPLHIGRKGRARVQMPLLLRQPQHVGHQDVGGGEAARGEPVAPRHRRLEPVQPALVPAVQRRRLGAQRHVPAWHGQHLHGVQRGEEPGERLGPGHRLGGQERLALLGDVQQAGAALEQADVAVLQRGDLGEGLAGEPVGQALLFVGDGADLVVEPRLLRRPAETDVAHMAARPLGHPGVSPDDERHGVPLFRAAL